MLLPSEPTLYPFRILITESRIVLLHRALLALNFILDYEVILDEL